MTRSQEPKPGDRVTADPTSADEEVLPAAPAEQEDDDDIVPGPLDAEPDDNEPLSDSLPGEGDRPDIDDGDPSAPSEPALS